MSKFEIEMGLKSPESAKIEESVTELGPEKSESSGRKRNKPENVSNLFSL